MRSFVVVRCISFLCASVQQSLILSPKVAAAFSFGFSVVVNIPYIPYIAHFLLSNPTPFIFDRFVPTFFVFLKTGLLSLPEDWATVALFIYMDFALISVYRCFIIIY